MYLCKADFESDLQKCPNSSNNSSNPSKEIHSEDDQSENKSKVHKRKRSRYVHNSDQDDNIGKQKVIRADHILKIAAELLLNFS